MSFDKYVDNAMKVLNNYPHLRDYVKNMDKNIVSLNEWINRFTWRQSYRVKFNILFTCM